MTNKYYTVFVSPTGKHDHTAFLWVETESEDIFKRALAAVEPRGLKVSKIYRPTDVLSEPDFKSAINI